MFWATANWLLDAASLWVFLRAYGVSLPVDALLAHALWNAGDAQAARRTAATAAVQPDDQRRRRQRVVALRDVDAVRGAGRLLAAQRERHLLAVAPGQRRRAPRALQVRDGPLGAGVLQEIQLRLERDHLPEGVYQAFKKWDVGDIVAAEGRLFKTKTGELSVWVERLRLMTKSLRPLPEKFHGLSDQEQRYRQRYVDLIVNEGSREVFRLRSRIVKYIRDYLDTLGFQEVETPMMQVIPGGARGFRQPAEKDQSDAQDRDFSRHLSHSIDID